MEKASSSSWQSRCRPPGVCGLTNSGNSCYLNAVLQCFCSTMPLVEYLLNHNTCNQLVRPQHAVAEVFVGLLTEMWLGQSSTYTPVAMRSMLGSLNPQFNNYMQQDAQELLLTLLNALHGDLKAQLHKSQRPTGWSIVSQLFEGELSNTTLCMCCDQQAQSKQVFNVLSLPIPKDANECSIQDCLSLFFQESVLTSGEQMLCSVCQVKRDTVVFTTLNKPPDILILHLKRFAFHGTTKMKLKTNVLFSMDKVDISPFLSNPSTHHNKYCLYAVVNHEGNLDTGHYTALCYNTVTCSWNCFDDSKVSQVPGCAVHSPNAYMLLYSSKPFQKPHIGVL